ncbi:hypothetical protein [Janthinobacterium sp. BJB304]|uniref:hypothetical protein n=1 Tax=Janthinobacterium sp. BJB304 TaxID=1572871 RepID=UPI00117AC9C3|nr:hypothetical protein [Janthinobacterium sp. BJB304]
MRTNFHCASIEDYGNGQLAIVRGSLSSGTVSPGMSLQIGLSGTFGMTVPITDILDSGELLIDCDDQEGVEMLLAFDVANEDLDLG